MANTKSALKNIRKSNKLNERNRQVRSRLKTLAKKVETTEGEAVLEVATAYISALDKAAKRGIIHANKASRHKAALASKTKGGGVEPSVTSEPKPESDDPAPEAVPQDAEG